MSFLDKSITEFTDVLSSKESVPGGGGASALVGAVGVALGNMVGALTVGKKTYADVEDDVRELMKQASALQEKLLKAIDGDAICFMPLAKAYSIPKDDPSRDKVMEEALGVACSVPLGIMHSCAEAIELLEGFAKMGSKLAISDAGCGALFAQAALKAASMNVYINTKSMKNRELAEQLEQEADDLIAEYGPRAQAIYENVMGRIR